jgi:hypothetical protein
MRFESQKFGTRKSAEKFVLITCHVQGAKEVVITNMNLTFLRDVQL